MYISDWQALCSRDAIVHCLAFANKIRKPPLLRYKVGLHHVQDFPAVRLNLAAAMRCLLSTAVKYVNSIDEVTPLCFGKLM